MDDIYHIWIMNFTRLWNFLFLFRSGLPGYKKYNPLPKTPQHSITSQIITTKLKTVRKIRKGIRNPTTVCKIIMKKSNTGIHHCWKYNPWQFPSLGNSGTLGPWYQGHWAEPGTNYTPARTTKHTNIHSCAHTQTAGTTDMAVAAGGGGSRNVGWLHNLSIAPTSTDYSGKAQCHEGKRVEDRTTRWNIRCSNKARHHSFCMGAAVGGKEGRNVRWWQNTKTK